MAAKNLFRQESMDHHSSVDKLNDIIQVENPKAWMVLGAVMLLLIGVCVWGIFGNMENTFSTVAISDGETVLCYLPEEAIQTLNSDAIVIIDEQAYSILRAEQYPVQSDDVLDEYQLHVGQMDEEEWIYTLTVDAVLEAGIYAATIITEQISPISLIVN